MTDATAAIQPIFLRRAAERAIERYQAEFDAACARARENFAKKPRGFLFKRLPTADEVQAWFERSYWSDDGFSEGRCLDWWDWLQRARRLHRLATTAEISDIRLPEVDLRFLRPFLNKEVED